MNDRDSELFVLQAGVLAGKMLLLAEQERDADGRFGTGGGSSSDDKYSPVKLDDHTTWRKYEPVGSTDLYHVTDSGNLHSIHQDGLVQGKNPLTPDGSPGAVVYFHTSPEAARMLASHIQENGGSPAILHLRSPAKILKSYDPRIDPEFDDLDKPAIGFLPDKKFLRNSLVAIHTDSAVAADKFSKDRVHPLKKL